MSRGLRRMSPPPGPNAEAHTVSPEGYIAWHDWAQRMAQTHRQRKCPGCGRWEIWTAKR